MSLVFKAVGAALVMLAALFWCREFKSATDRRISTLASFLRYLEAKERQIRTLGKESRAIAADFKDDGDIGDFAESVAEGRASAEAFGNCRGRVDMQKEARDILGGYFADCGADGSEGEIRRIRETVEGLRGCLDIERAEKDKRVRCAYAVGLALAAGLSIALM